MSALGIGAIGSAWRRGLRRGIRLAYHTALHLTPGRETPTAVCDSGWGRATDIPTGLRQMYDADAVAWTRHLLRRGALPSTFTAQDPELPHDLARGRGVLPLLGELYSATRSPVVWRAIETALRQCVAGAARLPAIAWDTTTAALRLVSIMRLVERVVPVGRRPPGWDRWLRDFIGSHAEPLAVGWLAEPEGNHRLVNVVGQVALHHLQHDGPMPPALLRRFRAVVASQFLADGGHIERSPHYHLQALSLAAAVARWERARGDELRSLLEPALAAPLHALRVMLDPSGAPLHLGDLARGFSGLAPGAEAERLVGSAITLPDTAWLPEFGLWRRAWRDGSGAAWTLFADCGPLGAPDAPGHGHADELSYLLYVDGVAVIADPGTLWYAESPESRWFKLREAHSTVYWPRTPSHTLGRYFRWQRLPPPPHVELPAGGATAGGFQAWQAWTIAGTSYRHVRRWAPWRGGLIVLDRVCSSSGEPAVSRLALHPEVRIRPDGPEAVVVVGAGRVRLRIRGPAGIPVQTRRAPYAPRYGERREGPVLEWSLPCTRSQCTFTTTIEPGR